MTRGGSAFDNDFQNDDIEHVRVPPNATLLVYEHSDMQGRYVELREGYHRLKDYDLNKRISSLKFSLDAWVSTGLRIGAERGRKPIGKPVVHTINGSGASGDSFSSSIVLGSVRSKGTNWHASASVTASVTIKQGGGPAPGGVEQTLSSTIEAGGGGDESKGSSRDVSVEINGVIGESGTIEADAIGQLNEATVQVFWELKNQKTGEVAEIEGEEAVEKFDVSFKIRHGKILDSNLTGQED